ncbi:hypothetical protein, partial [Blastomonas sp. CCH5-E3]|uniref:hypothetical protein n=1 Tax=Blastomonas sp. CCH5-E3 TaxID=1768750 RepID=UPI001E40472E
TMQPGDHTPNYTSLTDVTQIAQRTCPQNLESAKLCRIAELANLIPATKRRALLQSIAKCGAV